MNLKLVAIGAGGVAVLVGIVLFAISFDTVEPTEWGLAYNTISKTVDKEQVYDGGRYLIGFTKGFKIFPRTKVTIEFTDNDHAQSKPLRTRTQEGLALTLYISFQYQLIKENIPDLYDLSNVNFEETFTRIARDTILQEAGNYEAPEYWQNRTEIGDQMRQLLNHALGQAYATCTGFQILKIMLPDSYEDSIVETQVEVQQTTMKTFQQEAEIIRQQSKVLQSECTQNITVIEAEASSEAYYLNALAKAQARKNTLNMQSWVYNQAISQLNFNDTELSNYLFLTAVQNKENATIVFGVDTAVVQIK